MERIVNWLQQISTRRNLGIAILISALVISFMSYGTQALVYDVYGDADMPDLMFCYGMEEVSQAFQTLGSEGIHVWLTVHLLDYIFPLSYSLAIGIAIIMELKSLGKRKSKSNLALLPILGGLLDYGENLLIAQQALSYPNLSPVIISIASLFTTAKWVVLYLSFGIVFLFFIVILYRRSIGKHRED